MILVTVGTTMPFDELLEEVDRLSAQDFFGDEVVCQIGHSQYVPHHCTVFRNKPNLERDFLLADGLIVHGGTGSTIQAIGAEKPFVAVANLRAKGDHQAEFLGHLATEFDILWTRDPGALSRLWEAALRKSWRHGGESEQSRQLTRNILALARATAG